MNTNKTIGLLAALWGAIGVLALLAFAVVRLTPIALQTFNFSLGWHHWLMIIANTLFMAYSEGYKGFQLQFSPRVAARCLYLSKQPTILRIIFAPFFCMGFFHTTRRRQIITIVVTLAIIGLVQLIHFLSQPWRGIVDMGVVVGLFWGSMSLIYFLLQAFTSETFNHSAELPQ